MFTFASPSQSANESRALRQGGAERPGGGRPSGLPIVEKELIQPSFGIVHKLHMSIID